MVTRLAVSLTFATIAGLLVYGLVWLLDVPFGWRLVFAGAGMLGMLWVMGVAN